VDVELDCEVTIGYKPTAAAAAAAPWRLRRPDVDAAPVRAWSPWLRGLKGRGVAGRRHAQWTAGLLRDRNMLGPRGVWKLRLYTY
jgi:hypothetical protein